MKNSTEAPHLSIQLAGSRYTAFEMLFDARKEGLDNWRERMLQMQTQRGPFFNRANQSNAKGGE